MESCQHLLHDGGRLTREQDLLLLDLTRQLLQELDLDEVPEQTGVVLRRLFPGAAVSASLLEDPDRPVPDPSVTTVKEDDRTLTVEAGSGGMSLRFEISTTAEGGFDPSDVALLDAFAPTIAQALKNAVRVEAEKLSARRLQEELQVQRNFMSVVAHELRTPLSVILGYSETLAKEAPTLPLRQIQHISARTRDASRRLRRLIGDLVDVAQAERGHLNVELQPTSVERVLEQTIFETKRRSHGLDLSYEPDLPPVLADRDRLSQVLVNLVHNAEKFSARGTTIEVSAWRDGDHVAISVRDEGEGIAPEMIPRIFDRFFQVGQVEGSPPPIGMGIGLFLVRQICDQMNAPIEAESELGKGSCFTIRLPVTTAAEPPS